MRVSSWDRRWVIEGQWSRDLWYEKLRKIFWTLMIVIDDNLLKNIQKLKTLWYTVLLIWYCIKNVHWCMRKIFFRIFNPNLSFWKKPKILKKSVDFCRFWHDFLANMTRLNFRIFNRRHFCEKSIILGRIIIRVISVIFS